VLPPLWAGTNRAFCSRLEIELDTPGYLGPILLEWSDDGGYHWTGLRTMNDLAQAEGRRRVFTTRLGSFRQRVFCITAYGMINLYAVDADIQPGAW
jgi:transposase InsO family protein